MKKNLGKRVRTGALCGMLAVTLALAGVRMQGTWQAMAGDAAQATLATEGLTPAPGVLRVLLTRIQQTQRLDISLDGVYRMGPYGMAFQRGSKLTVLAEAGGLVVHYGGMALKVPALILVRHATLQPGEENGIRFGGEGGNLYGGDLVLSPGKEGGFRAVLHIPMEEYLLGVVPYEMSDSFPLEALKAQAITARTYAQRKLGGDQDYDLVDNTNDQVYKGANARNAKAAQAIAETANLCAYMDGALARCYYTASNGGQTELMQIVWPDGGKELFALQDDPYDVQNPASEVRRATLPKAVPRTGLYNEAMDALVRTAVSEAVEAKGYDGDAANIRISAVEAVSVHTPKNPEPSRLYTVLRLTVKVDARKAIDSSTMAPTAAPATPKPTTAAAGVTAKPIVTMPPEIPAPQWTSMQAVPDSITVDLPIFPQLEEALGLSINGSENELITVVEQADAFVLESRRFGHGVGMSQRGAQQMANQEGWNYVKILQFYYPGMLLQQVAATEVALPQLEIPLLTTPGPAPTTAPRPTLMPVTLQPEEGQWRGKVASIAADSWLNLRDAPNSQGKVLHTLYLDQLLLVVEELPDGWLKVKTDVIEGYVMAEFVLKDEAAQ